MNFRTERVSKLIREELAKIIAREIELPGVLATITEVDIARKMEDAKVNLSVIPGEKAETVLKELNKRAGYLQHLLLKKINIKPMPRIAFVIDHGYENAAKVEKDLMGQ
jgi:ribosome-binding factor A